MEKILYNAMLSKIQKEIKENYEEFEKLKKIDEKYCKINFEENDFIKIIEYYKQKNIENKDSRNSKIIFCNGNPYIVLNLAMIAIIKNISLKINIDNNMIGINKLILKIINDTLNENKLKIKIEICEKIIENEDIVFIDRINDFNLLKKKQKNIKFIPYKMIDIFYEDETFDELFEKIYQYALNQNIDIDVFEEEEIENIFKYGKSKIKLILTNDKNIIEKYKDKNVYINENPFKNQKIIFDEQMINEIIE